MNNPMISQKGGRLNIAVNVELNDKLNAWAERLGVTLSELTRRAISDFIERMERDKREQELAEACRNYRDFNKQFSAEWARFETRVE